MPDPEETCGPYGDLVVVSSVLIELYDRVYRYPTKNFAIGSASPGLAFTIDGRYQSAGVDAAWRWGTFSGDEFRINTDGTWELPLTAGISGTFEARVVPLPASLPLFFAGLAGIFAARRSRKRNCWHTNTNIVSHPTIAASQYK